MFKTVIFLQQLCICSANLLSCSKSETTPPAVTSPVAVARTPRKDSNTVKGYRVYLSKNPEDYLLAKSYSLPDIAPGNKINLEVDDLYGGGGIVTVVRPNGFIVSQKYFY